MTPVYTATITSRVDGQIVSVDYREGQMVRKGDILIQIDPRPYQALLTQGEGTLAHDEALLAEARIDLNRYQEAFNRNAIAKQQLDDQTQTVKQYEGSVKNDQGTVASATTNLDYATIRAPIDGRVGLRLVDPGNIVTSGSTTPLVVITQLQPITVIFSVAEDYLPQIQKQMRAGHKMSVDALDRDQLTKLASGSLLTLDNQIDIHDTPMKQVMTQNPKSVRAQALATEAVNLMQRHRITALPVTDAQGRLIGALNVHDLLRAGVV